MAFAVGCIKLHAMKQNSATLMRKQIGVQRLFSTVLTAVSIMLC